VVRRYLGAALVLGLTLALPSCGYSLAGRGTFLPAYIKTIGVPQFVNNTAIFEIEQRFTEKVRAEFIGRGKYQVLPQDTGVDAVLRGMISNLSINPSNFNETQQATRYTIVITTKIEFVDTRTNQMLWQNPSMVFREEYDLPPDTAAGDPRAFFGQGSNALERVATDFARSVVSAILEAF
jgi:Lipopolysaccharide-assembly